MKKIVFLSLMLLFIVGCSDNKTFSYDEISDCSTKELLMEKDGVNIYTYCVNNININVDGKKEELTSYINNNIDYLDNLTNLLEMNTALNDGGTAIYKGDITLISCHTILGNRDIYFGNKNMQFNDTFCK